MNKDLKIIKKKYGEDMMKLCRNLFPTILEQVGLLPLIMQQEFHENHNLYEDIITNNLVDDFARYIFNLADIKHVYVTKKVASPQELLKKAGYKLYECYSEEDIQSFQKYYYPGEELCTFNGHRLDICHVFFAVKNNAHTLKRTDFIQPKRQDEYGTSVLSIQFKRDQTHALSIKNRYNTTVEKADSTFANNLDNIIPGLTKSFAIYYGLTQEYMNKSYRIPFYLRILDKTIPKLAQKIAKHNSIKQEITFTIPGYVKASDNKLYKYNNEINGIYYCPDNIIIDHAEIKKYEKEKYIILDYFILNLQEKTLTLYDKTIPDSFTKTITDINLITIKNIADLKEITISTTSGTIIILLNKHNQIISIYNDYLQELPPNFLLFNNTLSTDALPNSLVRKKLT